MRVSEGIQIARGQTPVMSNGQDFNLIDSLAGTAASSGNPTASGISAAFSSIIGVFSKLFGKDSGHGGTDFYVDKNPNAANAGYANGDGFRYASITGNAWAALATRYANPNADFNHGNTYKARKGVGKGKGYLAISLTPAQIEESKDLIAGALWPGAEQSDEILQYAKSHALDQALDMAGVNSNPPIYTGPEDDFAPDYYYPTTMTGTSSTNDSGIGWFLVLAGLGGMVYMQKNKKKKKKSKKLSA